MKLELVEVGRLVPYEGNPRTAGEDALKRLEGSLREYGFVEPVIAFEDPDLPPGKLLMVVGHQRLKAALARKERRVPVVVYPFKSKAQALAYNIASNRLAELGDWDFPKLKDNIELLDTGALDIETIGFSLQEIENLMTWVRPDFDKTKDELDDVASKFTAAYGAGLQHTVLVFRCDDRARFDALRKAFSVDGSRACSADKLWECYQHAKTGGIID